MPQRRATVAKTPGSSHNDEMANLNPLKFCYHGQHSKPRSTFRTLPGSENNRQICAECYDKIVADRKKKKEVAPVRKR
jgi:hypothetical protein